MRENGNTFYGFLIMFLGCLGGIMKATCYVTLIAVVLVDLVWSAWGRGANA